MKYLLLSALLICVLIPRFDRQDLFVSNWTSDTQGDTPEYVAFVEHFRGESAQPTAPFSYRPLGPFLASWLPFNAETALNVINVAFLLAALTAIIITCQALTGSDRMAWIGGSLFVVSFPTFYYGSIGFVDPLAVTVIAIGLLAIVKQRWWLVLLVIAIGTFAKETSIVLIPPAVVAFHLSNNSWSRSFSLLVASLLIYLLVTHVCRNLISPDTATYYWELSTDRLMRNVVRPRTWLSFVLAFGIVGLLAGAMMIRLVRQGWRDISAQQAGMIVGSLLSVALFAYALLSAYSDGRPLWAGYPFMIGLAVQWLNSVLPGPQSPNVGNPS